MNLCFSPLHLFWGRVPNTSQHSMAQMFWEMKSFVTLWPMSLSAGFMLQMDSASFSGLDVPGLWVLMWFPGSGQRCPLAQEARHRGNLCKGWATAAVNQTSLLWCSHTWSSSRGLKCFQPFCGPVHPGLEGVLKKVLICLCIAVLNCSSLNFVLAQAFWHSPITAVV